MPYRLRAHLRFKGAGGLGLWARAQNIASLAKAGNLRPGSPAEERSGHSVKNDTYDCDLIFPDLASAREVWDRLIPVCIAENLEPDVSEEVSWMDLHECTNAEQVPCAAPMLSWSSEAV